MKRKHKKDFQRSDRVKDSVQIPMYAPNLALQPEGYINSKTFINFENSIEDQSRTFLKKVSAGVDEYNGSYMDPIINKKEKAEKIFLKMQNVDHRNVIISITENLWPGDKYYYAEKIRELETEYAEIEEEISRINRIYLKGTSLEYNEGGLKDEKKEPEL